MVKNKVVQAAVKLPDLPPVRGRITENAPLGAIGWFKTGGTADVLFKPADRDDLISFLQALPEEVPVQMFGVMSNCIIRDGGVRGVTIRLGRDFAAIDTHGNQVRAGALALDASVAKAAAEAGIEGLEFFSGIPGTIGGALRMNAGCYGTETKDVLVQATALDRFGKLHIFHAQQDRADVEANIGPGGHRVFSGQEDVGGMVHHMELSYRHNGLPKNFFFLEGLFEGAEGDPAKIKEHIDEIRARREDSQPIRERTGGSTFANPPAAAIAEAGLPEGTKVWQLIDMAGCRGLMVGGAQMSEKHANFMINTGTATAEDLENLGEEVRARVADKFGITLRWEIRRIGESRNP